LLDFFIARSAFPAIAFTGGALIVLLLAIGAVVVLPVALQYIRLASFAEWIIKLARWPALYVLVVLALAVIYRFGPDREHAQWHWITLGQCYSGVGLDRRFNFIFLVCGQFWFLQ
jgi:membrane protein